MLTHDMDNIQFQKLTPEDVWNLATLYAIQTVKDCCDEDSDSDITNKDLRSMEKNLRLLMFTDNEN